MLRGSVVSITPFLDLIERRHVDRNGISSRFASTFKDISTLFRTLESVAQCALI